ncbi:MAG TPA: hypothetical protein VMY42_19825 [Thermoguttaceae bacterium]|nr:hypothetical protein [Thermoguttaceae bacterium]
MLRFLSFCVGLLVVTGALSVGHAEEKAATATLPSALPAVGADSTHLITAEEAKAIRGKCWGCGADSVSQLKQFAIAGIATGTTTLLEGVFGQFEFINSQGLKVAGTFGGLEASIGVMDENLHISLQGKAFQETFEFAGEFVQQFAQSY